MEQAYEEGKIRDRSYHVYQRYLRAMEQKVNRNLSSRLTYYFLVLFRLLRLLLHELVTLGSGIRAWKNG